MDPGRTRTNDRGPGFTAFYDMSCDQRPVCHDPPSNRWRGLQAGLVERDAECDQQARPWARARSSSHVPL